MRLTRNGNSDAPPAHRRSGPLRPLDIFTHRVGVEYDQPALDLAGLEQRSDHHRPLVGRGRAAVGQGRQVYDQVAAGEALQLGLERLVLRARQVGAREFRRVCSMARLSSPNQAA